MGEPPSQLLLASANQIRTCPRCRQDFIDAFGMPELWWSDYCRNSNGYFGCETSDAMASSGISMWAFFEVKQLEEGLRYRWHKINIFTRWLLSTKQTIILLFDLQPPMVERLPCPLLDPESANLADPFWAYARIAAEVLRLEDSAVMSIRNHVRKLELQRQPAGKPQPDYRYLHDIARHAIHVSETLDVATQTMGRIVMQHDIFMKSMSDQDISQNTHSRLQFFESFIESLRHRSVSNEKRLLNEIQLAYNTVAQYDAGTSVEIGRSAQSDSASMKTIAFVTLTFLPPTFISAIFSMSFFDYSVDSGWTVSNKFWVYWAFAVPTTVITVILWFVSRGS
ncbi:uncharacterized protein BCR38DRAFT_457755 [Pseudomassariella vexata]|uniref:Cora-like Mg2+ transporter protein-domain-containing protein n=1 Tax=Pseudomassariella vexata TaxID=1141098 RepID=A0A1Y2DXT2_9PEZI|nr:uncharacterized protein BCR38DRAFT_457755 [Pseudomassariella vexata]ORY63936.1 hypothetical protein BCR38DRAFT_457755 [Pseudomassariella vexata]